MKTRHFLDKVDHDRILHAIRSAEKNTTGNIILYIHHKEIKDALNTAHQIFRKHRFGNTKDQNNILILLAPESQKFAIVGNTALHEKLGQAWWEDFTTLLSSYFKESHYTDGLIAAIEKIGQTFRTHFPAKTSQDRVDLPDIVEE